MCYWVNWVDVENFKEKVIVLKIWIDKLQRGKTQSQRNSNGAEP